MSKNIGFKSLLILFGIFGIIFYDKTIPLINDVIQLKINILGFFLEPLLQRIFDIPLRQAQIVSAWIYLLVAGLIFWYLFQKFYQALLVTYNIVQQSWLAKNQWQKISIILLMILLISALVKLVMMFV